MRLAPLARRSASILVATALLSTGGAASGLLTGIANAADESVTPSPLFARNSDSGTTTVVFTAPTTNFTPGATVLLSLSSNPSITISPESPPTVGGGSQPPNQRQLSATFDLRQRAPGAYNIDITNAGAPPARTYGCTSCFTISGFQPTFTSFSRDVVQSPSLIDRRFFRANGTNFARGATVTFEKGGIADPGIAFTASPDSPTFAPTGGDPNNPTGKNPTGNQLYGEVVVTRTGPNPAMGGTHDVVMVNTDGKRAVCTGCFIVPRIDSVTLSGKTVGTQLELARGVSMKDVIVKGDGFLAASAGSAGTVAKFHTPNNYNDTTPTTVNSTTVLDSQTLKLTVSLSTANNAASFFQDMSLSNPDGAYETFANALKINARPKFDANSPIDRVNPGVSSKGVLLTLTGTGFQTGATIAFAPADGITVNSFVVNSSTSAVVNIDIAAGAARTARALAVTNPDFGTTSGDTTASITPSAAPVITTASPTSVSRSTTGQTIFTLTLNGSGISAQSLNGSANTKYTPVRILFPDDPSIQVTTAADPNQARTAITATVTLPANAAPGPRRVQFMDKNFSVVECPSVNSACFTIDSIGVTGVTTTTGQAFDTNDKFSSLTITGSGFEVGAVVKLVRAGLDDIVGSGTTVVSGGVITTTVDLREAPPGGWRVRVTNTNGSTGVCASTCFTIIGSQPHLTSLSRSSVPAGSAAQVLTVTGTDFARGATLVFGTCGVNNSCNPQIVSSRFIDRQHYEFTLDTTNASTGNRSVQLKNTDDLITPAAECQLNCFTVSPAPTVDSISPAGRAVGTSVVDVTVTGTNFNGSPTLQISGTGITYGTTKNVSTVNPAANTFVVPVTVAPGAELTARTVKITNGDGGQADCSCTFTVKPGLTVASITPTAGLIGGSVPVTVTGTGFETGSGNVTLDFGPGVTVTNAAASSATTITANVAIAAGTARAVRNVVVTNSNANNGSSATLPSAFTLADLPGKPLTLAATRGNAKADLTWAAPADNGGTAVSSYLVTVTRSSDGAAVPSATITYPTDRSNTGAAVTNLVNGTAYTFTVKATSAVGTGPASDPVTNVKPATVPDPPTGAAATRGDASANVSWTAPVNTGGEPITGYTVTATPGSATVTVGGAARSATVTGLTNGTAYTFTVVATNVVGDSGPSNTTNSVTPLSQLPGAPTNVATNADAAAGAISLTWTAPTAPSQSPITSYTVRVSPAGGTVTYPADRTQTGATVTGLTNGTTYTFAVAATNSIGDGPDSESVTGTPYTVPGAVTNVAGTAGDQQITITWSAPTSDGGRPVSTYTATLTPGGATMTVSGTTATFTGLTNGTSYSVSVVATNPRGNGPAANAGPFKPATVPTAPRNPSATAGNGQATVSWTAPTSDGGSPLTGYTVTSSPGNQTATVGGTITTATVSGLTNGTAYTFTVKATNAVGNSPASTATAPVTPDTTVPTAPRNVAATPGNASATLTWTAPANDGGSAITSYTVTVSPSAGTVTYPADRTQTGATVAGLTNGTAYTFSVVATNAKGNSAAGTSPAVTPTAPGSTVVGLNGAAGTIRFGTALALTGRVVRGDKSTPIGVVSVLVQADDGTSRTLFRLRPSASGDYIARTLPSNNGVYTVRYDGDANNPVATSTGRRINVAVRITVRAPATATGTPLVVSGVVGPVKAGRSVVLYRIVGSTRQPLGSGVIASNGSYRISVQLARGSYTLEVGLGATPGNAAGASRFTVTRS